MHLQIIRRWTSNIAAKSDAVHAAIQSYCVLVRKRTTSIIRLQRKTFHCITVSKVIAYHRVYLPLHMPSMHCHAAIPRQTNSEHD